MLRLEGSLTHFMLLVSFYNSKKQKTTGLLIFSGGIETDQSLEIG